MTALIFCIVSFILVFVCGKRSLGAGIVALLTVGYSYGIVRANFPQNASHLIFDLGMIGLYAAAFAKPVRGAARFRSGVLRPWLAALIVWPVLLFFVPKQDWLIQVVGLRGAVFFLPLLLIGARLEEKDFRVIALGLAVLNIAEFGIGLWQFFYGIQQFFPRSAVTELIYRSNDLPGRAYRIPATFVSSAGYGNMMAFSIPFLFGAWAAPSIRFARKRLLEIGAIAAGIGVFLSASRTSAIMAAVYLLGVLVSVHLKASHRAATVMLFVVLAWVVAKDARLQRFTTLSDSAYVAKRIQGSVNSTFTEAVLKYPMGNGLGGGGTSIPYFLKDRLDNPVLIENEYARILLEEGLPGLFLWVALILWLLVVTWPGKTSQDRLGRLLLWCAIAFSFVAAPLGTGLLTAIPMTTVLMVGGGWLIGRAKEETLSSRAVFVWRGQERITVLSSQ
jgi:hypothetical protein